MAGETMRLTETYITSVLILTGSQSTPSRVLYNPTSHLLHGTTLSCLCVTEPRNRSLSYCTLWVCVTELQNKSFEQNSLPLSACEVRHDGVW